jgi:AI-2E family transporter
MVLFLTYFMLLSDKLFKRKLVEIVDTLSQKKVTVSVLDDIAAQIERFLVVQLLTSGVVAVATAAALWALGMQQAALWGLLAGVFNSIPSSRPSRPTADADAAEPCRVDEPGGRVRRSAVLELGLGRVGAAARRADDDGPQGRQRPRGAAAPCGTSSGRLMLQLVQPETEGKNLTFSCLLRLFLRCPVSPLLIRSLRHLRVL